ncbi:hypothetical protein EDF77_1899 [Stenotrophomonas maltophilia]|jgi:hypothetical protein|uniref:hypothetical protein n=1 Tax=Stenotrophomonas chelatiphaga TaxID=517011 RepID=UPI000F4CD2F4|nr:hypothetical protein [Stenotrophomonas chelatiphaga]MCS4231389.1 hypothetical protein [Stenotrophomonas chelatiphaga]ROQ42425.1 hypothetical protein EDF77_1899 [Stenotrophomonas maltophilia]
MKSQSQFHEPRSTTVFRHTAEAIRNSSHTDASLAQVIADQYMRDVAPGERILTFHVGTDMDSMDKAHKANAQIVARIRNGTVKMPADLEESWVRALPQPWSDNCARELANRYGFIGARMPKLSPQAGVLCVGRISVEYGQTIEALANVLADGRVCVQDVPELRTAREELAQMRAAMETLAAYVDGHLYMFDPSIGAPPAGVLQ